MLMFFFICLIVIYCEVSLTISYSVDSISNNNCLFILIAMLTSDIGVCVFVLALEYL